MIYSDFIWIKFTEAKCRIVLPGIFLSDTIY